MKKSHSRNNVSESASPQPSPQQEGPEKEVFECDCGVDPKHECFIPPWVHDPACPYRTQQPREAQPSPQLTICEGCERHEDRIYGDDKWIHVAHYGGTTSDCENPPPVVHVLPKAVKKII